MNDTTFALVIAGLAIFAFLLLIKPRMGCGVFILGILGALVLTTRNGVILIGGLIVLGIIYIFVKFGSSGDINVNVEGEGHNNITINGK